MVRCFSLHICLRLSAVQKDDKLHQTEPASGGRVVFLIVQERCSYCSFLASDTLYWKKKSQKILFEKELKKIIMNLQNPSR